MIVGDENRDREVLPSTSVPEQKRTKPLRAQKLERARPEAQKYAWVDMLAGRPFVLVADGRAQRFTLSLSEVYVDAGESSQRLRKIEPQSDARSLLAAAKKEAGNARTKLVLYPEGRAREAMARHFLNPRLLVQTSDRSTALATLREHGLRVASEPDYSPGSLIVEPAEADPESILRALSVLTGAPGVKSAGPLLGRYHQKHLVPNDTFFAQQWHLKNTGQGGGKVGSDMRVENVWNTYKGSGIRIGIVDDGLDILHPDLAPNVDNVANHYDWNDDPPDLDPSPRPNENVKLDDSHGTAVGGVAAARGNNGAGVSGVAPEATLVGFRLISSQDPDGTTDEEDAEAMTRGKDVIDIKNNSWGTGAPAWETIPAGPLMEAARQDAANTGRGGKGTVFVWAAGNGRDGGEQGQKDGATNSMFVTTVAGTDNRGNLAFYSEGGSHLVVSAPTSGGSRDIYSTDLRGDNGYNRTGTAQGEPADRNYTDSFGGTSASSPAVAGAVALMLEANPSLNWRDVKEILLRSSVQLFPTDAGWVTRDGGNPVLTRIKHHERYGGGLIDTQAAVALAETWQSLGPMSQMERSDSLFRSIPDNNSNGINITFDFTSFGQMRIEHAKLRLDVTHAWRGDLEITLRSPSGTVSTLASREIEDDGLNYDDWIFTSVRHWGEAGVGLWTLTIKDLSSSDIGFFHSATLTLFGTDASAPQIVSHTPGPLFLRSGDPLNMTAQGTGGGHLAYIWSRDGSNLSGSGADRDFPTVTTSHGGTYRVTVANAGGTDVSDPILVGVVGPQNASVIVNQDATLNLPSNARGPGLSYQWRREGVDLVNGARPGGGIITGATGPTLSITAMQPADEGAYTCVISMAGVVEPIESNVTAVTLRVKPVLNAPNLSTGVRNSLVNFGFTASNSPTSFRITGMPAGVTFNTTTGALGGRPGKAGSYLLKVAASNAAGSSAEIQVPWTVDEFPTQAVGTWEGIMDRNADLNQKLGGRFRITVTTTGAYSGSLTLGTRSVSWKGFVDALSGGVNPTTPLSISLGRNVTPLTGSFKLDYGTKTLVGSFSDTRPTTLTSFSAVQQTWSSKNRPVSVSTPYNTALLPPAEHLGVAAYPQGSGHAVLSLSTSGVVAWSGRTADDTTFTGSSALGAAGQTCLHVLLYSKFGSLQGWSTIALGSGLADGTLSWYKNRPTATTRSYAAGIPEHGLTVRGARYTKPGTGVMLIGLTPPVLTTDQNARLLFTGAPLAGPLQQTFHLTAANAVKMPAGATLNPQSVKLTLAAATGKFTGSIIFKDNDPFDVTPPIAIITRTAKFAGLLVTRPDLNQGIGAFNLAELPDTPGEKSTTSPILSGKVEILSSP
jgi:subtilisin-like proprotein convertase family protein